MNGEARDRDTASYVYAVARPTGEEELSGVRGVRDLPVHLVTRDDLAAVVSAVPREEFDEETLRARLADWKQLEALARAHHTVVDTVAGITTVIPMRLATVYHGDDRVRAVLRENGPRFEAVLRRLEGNAEWGVKLYADPAGANTREVPADAETRETSAAFAPNGYGSAEPEPPTRPGKAYLDQRRAQRRRREDSREAAAELAQRVDGELRALAEARYWYRPQDTRLSGASGENVLNAAYLVARERSNRFLATVDNWRGRLPAGVRIEVSGPWAPYSFVSFEEDEDPQTAPRAPGGHS